MWSCPWNTLRAVRCGCRRTLASPDFQLLCGAYDECGCGSGLTSATCCHQRPADRGTLWAQFHLCDCPYPFDPLVRPEVSAGNDPVPRRIASYRSPWTLGPPRTTVLDCSTVINTWQLWVQQLVRTCRCLPAQGCKWHKPHGCSGRLHCPFCLILPGLNILRKISNHLDLIKGEPAQLHHFDQPAVDKCSSGLSV